MIHKPEWGVQSPYYAYIRAHPTQLQRPDSKTQLQVRKLLSKSGLLLHAAHHIFEGRRGTGGGGLDRCGSVSAICCRCHRRHVGRCGASDRCVGTPRCARRVPKELPLTDVRTVSQIYGEVSGEHVFTRQTRRCIPGTAKTLEASYLGRRTGKHISTGSEAQRCGI
jgi:hypothetical protein